MSEWVDVHFQALETCGKRARSAANMLTVEDVFQDSSAKKPADAAQASMFGDLSHSGALAGKVNDVWSALKEELGTGRSRLQGVEKAIDQVETNLRKATKAATV
ncbi:hypothetical protein HTZ77_02140 [Nonomuraea sp. SMC257]|uniref:Uncharacterized protein n=1 Tax=Nonomuraea montanisoli TaxID=2741721 RepID=A0A7Y6I320_9ACTN|nr:hypothetical protein [Nonomuraea montanisoli]NUW30233.1 hypothetical protein [Nonomuraea montanisoli]